jgi:N6-L-threonylcarbamoyladenine synthase
MSNSQDLEMSFSGLKTAVVNLMKTGNYVSPAAKNLLAYDLEQAIVEVLIKKMSLAITRYRPVSLLLGGGVVANRWFRQQGQKLSEETGIPIFFPPLEYCGDNAVMVGAAGILTYEPMTPLALRADPSLHF